MCVKKTTGIYQYFILTLFAAAAAAAERLAPAAFYVDSERGDDAAVGTAETCPWKSLDRVNAAELIPGDRVLFKRGGLWRGQLVPKSGTKGAPIIYSAFGEGGAKPLLQGSVSRDRPDDWVPFKPGLWTTRPFEPAVGSQLMDLTDSYWNPSFQEGAKGVFKRWRENDRWFNRLICEDPGQNRHQIQLWGPQINELAPALVLRLRLRSSIPFKLETFEVMRNSPPWTVAARGVAPQALIGPEWQTVEVLLLLQERLEAARLHTSIGGMVPRGAVFDFDVLGLWRASIDGCNPIACDAGILILNHGEKWGVKKWTPEDLKAPLDYWYDAEKKRVVMACDANPALAFQSVELALTRHIVNQSSKHDIIYDGLAVRYGAAHGFGGGNTARIIIRNCDVYWIGGGLQYWKKRENGTEYPVRYGNGIEFWNAARDNLVENNRLWEIYDAALTNQGNGDDSIQENITYRNNVIWRAEYSFEYWNRPKTAVTRNIVFEHNTCVDAGFGWGHAQRPNPNGAHLMFYNNDAATTNLIVRNNIFSQSSEVCARIQNDWRGGLTLRNNLYWQTEKPVLRWQHNTYYGPADFARYQSELGLDEGSLLAEPQFVDPAARDYRLKPGSPGSTLAADGGPVGARLPN